MEMVAAATASSHFSECPSKSRYSLLLSWLTASQVKPITWASISGTSSHSARRNSVIVQWQVEGWRGCTAGRQEGTGREGNMGRRIRNGVRV